MPRHRFADTRDRIETPRSACSSRRASPRPRFATSPARSISRKARSTATSPARTSWCGRLFERHYVAFAERLHALAEGEPTARGKMAAMIRGFCQAHDDDPTLFRFLLFVQHGQLREARARARRRRCTVMQSVVDAAIAAGEIPGAGRRPRDRAGLRRRAAAGHVCGLRRAAAGDGARCVSV